jgi:hypothetical protein
MPVACQQAASHGGQIIDPGWDDLSTILPPPPGHLRKSDQYHFIQRTWEKSLKFFAAVVISLVRLSNVTGANRRTQPPGFLPTERGCEWEVSARD